MNSLRHLLSTLWLLIGLVGTLPAQSSPPLVRIPLSVDARFARFYTGDDSLMLPDGFAIGVYYAGLKRPRLFAWSPAGVLHVADMEAGAIMALPDTNGDDIADTAIAVAGPVDSANSMAFHDGALYVAEPSRVRKFRDNDGDGIYEQSEPFIEGIHSTGTYNHFTRTILFDTTNRYIYLSVGASCNACREDHPERGTILRFDLDGNGRTIYASGLRNAIGLAIDPATGALWATNADRDHLGDDAPEEIVTTVEQGAFYGWPFAYGAREWIRDFDAAPEYASLLPLTSEDSQRVATMRIADIALPPHSTPIGIAWYYKDAFPGRYRNAMFVAQHGSSPGGRTTAVGYNVVCLRKEENGSWRVDEFLSGFLTDPASYTYWGRPCGITVDGSGALYVGSDRGIGAVYRITYTPPIGVPSLPDRNISVRVVPNPARLFGRDMPTFTYNLPVRSRVTLDIYNAHGEKTATLLHSVEQEKGSQTLGWDHSMALPSGAYYYRLRAVGESGETYRAEGAVIIFL